jgi:CoA:oxalate CoA-transferase
MTARPPPLDGVTVIDLGQVYQGPYAAFLMAKAGARVIKVEPRHGEPLRAREAVGGGASLPLAMLNSNKRAITLNLKTARGVELLKALASKADVLLENFAPGVMDKLGVGAEVLMAANPRLVYASATGYGLSGPERDNLAMDITIQAASGAISVTGFADGPPVKAGPAIADFLSGTHLYGAIVTALYERERTGIGRLVEVAMIETMFPTLASNLGMIRSGHSGAPATATAAWRSRPIMSTPARTAGSPSFAPTRSTGETWSPPWGAATWPTIPASPPTPRASSTWKRPTRWSKPGPPR